MSTPNPESRYEFARQNEAWGPLTPAERREWTLAISDFPPLTNQVNSARYTQQQVCTPAGIVTLDSWVSTARQFDQLGFTAHQWHLLTLTLNLLHHTHPHLLTASNAVEFQHLGERTRVVAKAHECAAWVQLIADAHTLLQATTLVLQQHSVQADDLLT